MGGYGRIGVYRDKEEHMDKLLGEQFWLPMYMAGAQCKTLILNTDAQAAFHVGPSWAPVGHSWAPVGPDWGPFGNAAWDMFAHKEIGNTSLSMSHTCGGKWPLSFYFL